MVQAPSTQCVKARVLIVDDEEPIRNLCSSIVSAAGFEPHTASDGIQGLQMTSDLLPDYVLLDVNMPNLNGMDLLKEIRTRFPTTRVVMVTGYSSVDCAVEAMKLGAYDYITKPFEPGRLKNVLTNSTQTPESATPDKDLPRRFLDIVGVSAAMQRIYELIQKAARSDCTVVIEGESGTGKELVARAIHARSAHLSEPFVPVNCGAIAPTLIESELFGHAAGAFTDAKNATPGLLRAAGHGTVFLDEIGELPQEVQVKLLRALQEMEVLPVGCVKPERFHARIVAATNLDLSKAVERGKFRHDLFYRLHVIPVFLPPLRERREDIPLLIEHFIRICTERFGRNISISPAALRHFMAHQWHGNIRELENTIQRVFALLDGDIIEISDALRLLPPNSSSMSAENPPPTCLASHEALLIRNALEQSGGNKRQAARTLGIGIATLYRKIKKHNIIL